MPSEYHTQRKIEFADTDQAGIVHFARFFVFMETAEHEFINSLGTSVCSTINGNKICWPRLAASCEYLSPLRFEDIVDIHLKVVRKGTKSITYSFEFNKGDKLCARGEVSTICCICNPGEALKSIAIPSEFNIGH